MPESEPLTCAILRAVETAALTEDGREGKVHNLTGPETLKHQEMAEKLSDALNRKIEFIGVSPEAMRGSVSCCRNPGLASRRIDRGLCALLARRGFRSSNGVQEATRKPPRSFDALPGTTLSFS